MGADIFCGGSPRKRGVGSAGGEAGPKGPPRNPAQRLWGGEERQGSGARNRRLRWLSRGEADFAPTKEKAIAGAKAVADAFMRGQAEWARPGAPALAPVVVRAQGKERRVLRTR